MCPCCPHEALRAQHLLKHTLINPGRDWSIFTVLIYENTDQQGLWSIWFSHVSPGLYNSWLGKAACCSQGRGWGKSPSFHPHSSSLNLHGPHHPGLEVAFTSWVHPCLTGCCVWPALWKAQRLSCIWMTCMEPPARTVGSGQGDVPQPHGLSGDHRDPRGSMSMRKPANKPKQQRNQRSTRKGRRRNPLCRVHHCCLSHSRHHN